MTRFPRYVVVHVALAALVLLAMLALGWWLGSAYTPGGAP